jgi:G3E family GTPase
VPLSACPCSQEDKEHEHDTSISSVGIEREGLCNMDLLQQWLGGLLREKGADLFRSKGVLAVTGSNDRCGFFVCLHGAALQKGLLNAFVV